MKPRLLCITIMAGFVLLANNTHAQEQKYKKQKSYSKSYNLSSSSRITLDNMFGDMKLVTWDKNEIKVDVSMAVTSTIEARAQAILNSISITDEQTAGGVSFKTIVGKTEKEPKAKNVSEEININYTVYLPAGNPLNAKNQFGSMTVPDYKGEVTLDSEFGSLTAGKLGNVRQIIVKFGKADIEQVNNGAINIDYTPVTIKKLYGNINAKFQFSQAKLDLDNDVRDLSITNTNSDLYLDVAKDLSASYRINTTFGSFTNKSNFKLDQSANQGDIKNFAGKSGSGNTKITVTSNFGGVTLGHDLKVDMSKKKKA